MQRHELSQSEWETLKPLLPKGGRGRPTSSKQDRKFINAVLFWAKTGVPWRDLPRRYGSWKTVYNRFNNWSAAGHWERIFKTLRVEIDQDASMADGTIVRAHQHAAGGKGGPEISKLAVQSEAGQPRFMLSWTV
jgi:transposase